jgi:cytochrome c551/c552
MIRLIYITFLTNIFLFAQSGSILFNGNCSTCHFIDKSVSAPSMNEVRKRYIEAFPKKSDFIEYMSNWVVKPNKQGSLMHDKIEKFELMPELGFDKSTVKIIAEYIYQGKLEATTR